jgi:hypothetical protein
MSTKRTRKPGRPATTGTTPQRQLGRVRKREWNELKRAARLAGQTFAGWAVAILLETARKQREERDFQKNRDSASL